MTSREIISVVAASFGTTIEKVTGRRRNEGVVVPRQVAMYLVRQLLHYSYPQIGRYFCRDHATVINACERVVDRMGTDEEFRRLVESIRRQLEFNTPNEAPVCVACARREEQLREARAQLESVASLIRVGA